LSAFNPPFSYRSLPWAEQPGAFAAAQPFGKSGITLPLLFRNGRALFQQGNVAFDTFTFVRRHNGRFKFRFFISGSAGCLRCFRPDAFCPVLRRMQSISLIRTALLVLLISALKSKLFPAEDRQPKSVVFG
jgi:hypothetical protein